MSLKNVVVEGCEFEIYENNLLNSSGNITITSQASSNSKVDGNGIYTSLILTVSGFTSLPSVVPTWIPESGSTVNPAVVESSANYVKVDGVKVILEGDEAADVTIIGQKQEGMYVVTAQTTITIKIKSAGQSYMKAE